ncbi:glycosyltransferase [Streptomyces sp. NBC_00525]|uniref:glycosyltransferase n=1 Tax=Streptomyces sp. NBC_00525 TaxID=2903660 RepID=UPI002E807F43|nr:glycosyltransferase [Streptomyces sp. NBC_00525]WUC95849.1 DUF3492 domain-containing protein [Streptomyces sp. NBC_00525]
MRIGLLTDGGYPYATGESRLWCDRLVRGLAQHEFDLFALSRSAEQEARGWVRLPDRVRSVRTAPLWTADEETRALHAPRGPLARLLTGGGTHRYGRREQRLFATHFTDLAAAVCTAAPRVADERFTRGLNGLADLAADHGGLPAALRSETAVRILEAACRAPGTGRTVQTATVADLLAFTGELDRALRPLSLDWYDEDGLAAVDLCHATSGGTAALPGLLAKRFFGTPLLVTEYAVRVRAHYLASGDAPAGAPVRALLAGFHGLLATEVYRQAALITPGNTHARRWQQRCGADPAKLRTVYPGMESARFDALGEREDDGGPDTLVWVGRIEPAKDLVTLLHAFARVHAAAPDTRLRIIGAPTPDPAGAGCLERCRAVAARLFPDTDAVTFEETGGPGVPDVADAYAAGGVVVLSSVVEGFPISLVEAMFCGRATVSTDVGAVVEVIGGTGLVVPPRNPRALADACLALLRDPARRARLGAAARARALELFTVEQNLTAFDGIYLDLIARAPRRDWEPPAADEGPRPFATPPEFHMLDHWPDGADGECADRVPSRAGAGSAHA